MVEAIVGALSQFIQNMFMFFGPMGFGIILAMAIESACIPLPSEIIMPFAGYLAVTGFYKFGGEPMTLFWIGILGAFGCLVGSIAAYAVGKWGGRPFLNKYGKYVLISRHDLDMADSFFNKYGEVAIFTSRLLPVIRTFISLPAGISRMRFGKFCFYTFLGSMPWCWFLSWIGWKIGKHAADINSWKESLKLSLGRWMHLFDVIIVVLIIAAVIWYIMRHIRLIHKEKEEDERE
ncbi:MAG: DedA family protein [Candidatus Goldbacteria bacterium]|nr:DedA family protein [Candidatus Goldiibacteriota bacterium]